MRLLEELRGRRAEIVQVTARHGAGNVAVFGSVARGEETEESDVDLLIDVVGPTSAWFPGGLVAELEEMFGRRVQVVTRRSLHARIRETVLREAVAL
ncbi:MAG: nucleotidyltransferase family protein [Acidobacteria bacterium]|nr:nucleotidyltransferase family protein [Acidobacteriota bacterium]